MPDANYDLRLTDSEMSDLIRYRRERDILAVHGPKAADPQKPAQPEQPAEKPKSDEPKADEPKTDEPKTDEPKADEGKPAERGLRRSPAAEGGRLSVARNGPSAVVLA